MLTLWTLWHNSRHGDNGQTRPRSDRKRHCRRMLSRSINRRPHGRSATHVRPSRPSVFQYRTDVVTAAVHGGRWSPLNACSIKVVDVLSNSRQTSARRIPCMSHRLLLARPGPAWPRRSPTLHPPPATVTVTATRNKWINGVGCECDHESLHSTNARHFSHLTVHWNSCMSHEYKTQFITVFNRYELTTIYTANSIPPSHKSALNLRRHTIDDCCGKAEL